MALGFGSWLLATEFRSPVGVPGLGMQVGVEACQPTALVVLTAVLLTVLGALRVALVAAAGVRELSLEAGVRSSTPSSRAAACRVEPQAVADRPSEDDNHIGVMTEAIFALIGVLVGGLITWGVQYSVEARKEARAVRGAARVLATEFASALRYADAVKKAQSWKAIVDGFSDDLWIAHRDLLASALSPRDWELVDAAYVHWSSVRRKSESERSGPAVAPDGPALTGEDKDALARETAVIKDGFVTLTTLTGPFPFYTQLRRRTGGSLRRSEDISAPAW